MLCCVTDTFCNVHREQINDMHEYIILATLNASSNSIPVFKPLVSKVMPGWNKYVDMQVLSIFSIVA